jgi:exodeoxyribonuclease III
MAIKIASYNLWDGSNRTYFRFIDFIKSQHIDVLCLQEINGWQDENFAKLNDFADRAGYTDYEYGNSNSEYKLATLSMLPVVSKTVHQEGFWHCVVETHVKAGDTEIVIFNVHLDPWKEDPRIKEIEKILSKVDPSKPTIITGDFNSLSQQDNYPPEFLTMLQERKFYKFGQDALDFRVTDTVTNAGFIDVAARLAHLDVTAPTPYGESGGTEEVPVSEVPARIDYAFVSSSLLPMVKDFQVIKNEETNKISDHFPIVLTLDIEPGSPQPAATAPAKVPEQPKPAIATPALTPQQPASLPESPAPKNNNAEGELIIKHDQ